MLPTNRPPTSPESFLGPVGVCYNSQRRAGMRYQEMGVMELARAVAVSGTTSAVAR